jgi:hypothetical protein
MTIQRLFDPAKDIYRTIEKVITYNASQEARLRAEITEYIVTESIEEQFEKLLSRMQAAMDHGGGNEVGVWVSGFYGSGKSSFTKYLGLALDERVTVDGTRFLRLLQDRLNKPQTRALLNTLAGRYSAAVVLLDLASEMLAGATMEDVSTVLYYKVLQWAGYSRNLKVAALERRLQKDGRYEAFRQRIEDELGMSWPEVQNDPLVIDSLIPELAHEFYPQLFKTPGAFTTETAEFVRFENERVREMIEIAREATGKQHIIFIIDEVGQYVGSRPNLILNLDGLAKNLKDIGDGRVWIIGTAQQTLTEDDPRAALNSPELYKLKDRFPIQIDLESSDIKEICYRRLLGKSSEGERTLGALFDQHGQALRHNTKLQDARYYDADFDRTTFTNLYPFLPAHFDVLLHLLGALAKSTGGVGLRSAIKVIQDILVEGPDGHTPVADQPVGWLATTVTLYDALEKDIRRAAPSIHKAVGKAIIRFGHAPLHVEVAKTVAVLQILGNMPVTAQNVTSLMHPAVEAPSRRAAVDAAIADLIGDSIVPFGEKDGGLAFFSEKLNDIEQERAQIPLSSIQTLRIRNEALREAFSPLPSVRLQGTLSVTSGLKAQVGARIESVAGEREPVQTIVELVDAADYETARTRLLDESRARSSQSTVFLLGRAAAEIEQKAGEIYRCNEIASRYRNDPDQEVREYCAAQIDRAGRLGAELQQLLRRQLVQGSFIFRGRVTAVESLDPNLLDAAKKHLNEVAEQVFDRYGEAPVRAETSLAEKFLKVGSLRAVTAAIDPLGLVQISGSTPSIKTTHKALISIRDFIQRGGTVDGKRLTDIFTEAPFGWSQDTLRYLVGAMLVAGELKLKVSGREVTVNGQQAIEALRTNQAFRTVGIALRDDPPSIEMLARAAERLTEICGDTVVPIEDDISKAAIKFFPKLQLRYGGLPSRLDALHLPNADVVRALTQELADVLLSDASDAPQRLGAAESPLYERLRWANEVEVQLNNGLEETLRDLQRHRQEIASLPSSGAPGRLKEDLKAELQTVALRLEHERFYSFAADLRSALTKIKARVDQAVAEQAAAQAEALLAAGQELTQHEGWPELTQEEQSAELAKLERLSISASGGLRGLRELLNHEFAIQDALREIRAGVTRLAVKRRAERADEERRQREEEERRRREEEERRQRELEAQGKSIGEDGLSFKRDVKLRRQITSAASLDEVIAELQQVRTDIPTYATDITVTIELEG